MLLPPVFGGHNAITTGIRRLECYYHPYREAITLFPSFSVSSRGHIAITMSLSVSNSWDTSASSYVSLCDYHFPHILTSAHPTRSSHRVLDDASSVQRHFAEITHTHTFLPTNVFDLHTYLFSTFSVISRILAYWISSITLEERNLDRVYSKSTMDFSSPLTAPPTSPQSPSSPIKRGLKRKVSLTSNNPNDSSRLGIPETPTKRVPVIDLCTPSPAANKVFDLLGLCRRPLAEVGVPNVAASSATDDGAPRKAVVEAEKERSSFEGYLALCRMTRQASQRSLPTRQTTIKAVHSTSVSTRKSPVDGGEDAMVESNAEEDEAEEKETEEETQRRLRKYRERNVRAVVGRSRGAVVGARMAPGKSVIRTARITRDQQPQIPESNTSPTSESSETVSARTSTSLVSIDTLPRIRNRYLESFVSHQHEDVMYVEPNPDHAAFRRRDWSPIYACAYSHGTSSHR